MYELIIDSERVQKEITEIQNSTKKLKQYEEQIDKIAKEIGSMGGAFSTITGSLKDTSSELENLRKKVIFANTILAESVSCYIKTETKIKENKIKLNEKKSDEKSETSTKSNDKTTNNEDSIDNYDYTYSEDNIAVPIDKKFLDKDTCLEMAERIINEHGENGECNGMSKKRIAKELYAHAVGYYASETLQSLGIDGDFIQDISESAEVADIGLGDGLDVHYNLIWYLIP